jgi:hypothetical protein
MLAAFNATKDPTAAGWGAVLGVVVACAIGYWIYRGGIKINLERLFKITAVVLVIVAAGLLATAAHTAHEAAWLNVGQTEALNLRWLVDPGSIRSALLTGMLGIQPQPAVVEVIVWLLYAVPMTLFVLWPAPRQDRTRRSRAAVAVGTGAVIVIAAIVIAACGSSGSNLSGSTKGSKSIDVKLVDAGCDHTSIATTSGATTFNVSNDSADAVTEFEVLDGSRIVGEVEDVAPGLSKSFSITLQPKTYTTHCTGGTKNDGKGRLLVSGAAVATAQSPAAAAAVQQYREYLEQQTTALVDATRPYPLSQRCRPATWQRPSPCTRQPEHRTSASSPSPSRSAISTHTSTREPATSRHRSGAASTGSSRRCTRTTPPPAWPPSPGSSSPT